MIKDHCCEHMSTFLSENELYFGYSPVERKYYIMYADGGTAVQRIANCPWCGSKLPKVLRDEWFATLKKEFGIEYPYDDEDKIPSEFKTDEWWKKRGL